MTPASGPPPRPRYGHPLTLVAVAAVALLAGAGAAALATSGSSSTAPGDSVANQAGAAPSASGQATPSPSASSPAGPRAPGRSGGFFGGGIGGGFSGAPVHGTLVVPASGGGYATEDIQRGKVTAISGSSVTVVSADKYTRTYQMTSSASVNAGTGGLAAIKVGDQVSLTATAHGSAATVTSVIDLSRLGIGSSGPGGGYQGQPSS